MTKTLSSYLVKIAELIERDNTPIEPNIRMRRHTRFYQTPPGEQPKIKTKVREETIHMHMPPKIKPPRALAEHQKKWNADTKSELMKNYMRDYRSEGKIYETNSPKSMQIKKPKTK